MATATDDNAADKKSDKSIWQLLNIRCTSYGNRIRAKYTAKWGVQIAGMLFQTRSSPERAGHKVFEINFTK